MSHGLLETAEAERIAGELAAKYGGDALDFVRSRAARAQSVGDDLAYGAWLSVLGAAEALFADKAPAAD